MNPPPDRAGDRSSMVPIEWWPGKHTLSAIIRRSRVQQQPRALNLIPRNNVDGLTPTKYKDWPFKDAILLGAYDCGDWEFFRTENLTYQNETMNVLFSPPLPVPADAEDGVFVQKLISSVESAQSYPWPNVLYDLRMVVDRSEASNTGLGVNLTGAVPRRRWRNGQGLKSVVVTRTYVSSMKPPRRLIECDEPVTTEIHGDFYGQPVHLPECLHPDVRLLSLYSDEATVFDCTPGESPQGSGNLLFYEATNHADWQDHVFDVDCQFVDGLWRRVERTVYVPEMPEITYA